MAHDPYDNPFLYGFAPWPLGHEDATTTDTTVDPLFYAGISEPSMGKDPTIPAVTYEGAKEDVITPVGYAQSNLDMTTDTAGAIDPTYTDPFAGSVAPLAGITRNLTDMANIDIENRSYDVKAPLTGITRNLTDMADIPIEERSYDLTATEQAKKDLWANQPWTSAMAENKAITEGRLLGTDLGTDLEVEPSLIDPTYPFFPGTDLEAEPSLIDPTYPFFPGTDLEAELPLLVEEDEDEEFKMTMRDKFQAWLKKGSQATKKALLKVGNAIAPNFGLDREELTGTGPGGGYTDSQVDFMMMNALGKQAVDEGLFVSGFDYKNTSSGVQDPFNYNVYASNYQEPGSASYEKWKNIKDSKAWMNEKAKEVAVSQAVSQAVSTGNGATGNGATGDGATGDGGGYWGGVTDIAEMGSFAKGGRVKYGNGGIVDLL